MTDVAGRMDTQSLIVAPMRRGDVVSDVFIVDRRWQSQGLSYLDTLVLNTFCQLAAQIIEQNSLQRRAAHQATVQDWEDMAFYAAHECREPVNAIDLLLSPLQNKLRKKGLIELLFITREIKDNVNRAKTFINDFMGLVEPESLDAKPVRVDPLVRKVWRATGQSDKSVKFRLRCGSDLSVIGDETRLFACFAELFKNAIACFGTETDEKVIAVEANKPAAKLLPRGLDRARRFACIHVEDTGPGIPEVDRPRVFNPRFTKRKGGSGFGLVMVKRVVDAHGGKISVHAAAGSGTRFTIFLPLA